MVNPEVFWLILLKIISLQILLTKNGDTEVFES